MTNQFGVQQMIVGPAALFLAVPSEKAPQGQLPPDPLTFTIDHFRCYQAQGQPIGLTVSLDDQFASSGVRSDSTLEILGARARVLLPKGPVAVIDVADDPWLHVRVDGLRGAMLPHRHRPVASTDVDCAMRCSSRTSQGSGPI